MVRVTRFMGVKAIGVTGRTGVWVTRVNGVRVNGVRVNGVTRLRVAGVRIYWSHLAQVRWGQGHLGWRAL